jgi:predicted membrane protein
MLTRIIQSVIVILLISVILHILGLSLDVFVNTVMFVLALLYVLFGDSTSLKL